MKEEGAEPSVRPHGPVIFGAASGSRHPCGQVVPWGGLSDGQTHPAAFSWDSWVCDRRRNKRGCSSPSPVPGSRPCPQDFREQRRVTLPHRPDAVRGVGGPPQAGLPFCPG